MRLFLAVLALAVASNAAAQSLTVLSSNATKALIQELAPRFEKSAGVKVDVRFDNSAALRQRIDNGEDFDVVVLSDTTVKALSASGKLLPASVRDIGRTGVGMAIHPSGSKPDISTLDGLKAALMRAKSVTYVEQGATAPVMRAIFAKLGLTELVNARTVYSDSAAEAVAQGKAEIGFTQISEILNVPGAVLAAPLPAEIQTYTTFQAAARPSARPAAGAFIDFLSGPQAATVLRQKGMELPVTDRLPPIPASQLTAAQRDATEAFKVARGAEVSGPFHPLLRSPELMTRTRAMGDYLRYKSALPPRLSEFVILLTSREWTQQYEWNAHYAIALKAGVSKDVADAIAEGRRPSVMPEEESTLYDFVRELHRTKGVSDATYARALKAFGEQGVVDTVGITGYYTLLAMVLNTSRTSAGAADAPQLKPLPQ